MHLLCVHFIVLHSIHLDIYRMGGTSQQQGYGHFVQGQAAQSQPVVAGNRRYVFLWITSYVKYLILKLASFSVLSTCTINHASSQVNGDGSYVSSKHDSSSNHHDENGSSLFFTDANDRNLNRRFTESLSLSSSSKPSNTQGTKEHQGDEDTIAFLNERNRRLAQEEEQREVSS